MEAERAVPAGHIRLVFGFRNRRASSVDPTFLLLWLGGLLGAGLMAGGMWLCVRRLSGALQSPLSTSQLVTLALAVAGLALVCRLPLFISLAQQSSDSPQRFLLQWTPSGALILIAAAAIVPGTSAPGAVFFWVAIVTEETASGLLARRINDRRTRPLIRDLIHRLTKRPLRRRLGMFENNTPPGEICQTFTRHRTADGREIVHGMLRVSFAAGQRTAIEHLAFCPLLCGTPQLSAAAVDELDCSVRVTQAYRYGARLEVKLSEPCEAAMQVLLRFRALASRR
jgi:hypothetical protein